MDNNTKTRELKLKTDFKETPLYKYGVVWLNKRKERDYRNVKSFEDLADLSVKQKNHEHIIPTSSGGMTTALENTEIEDTPTLEELPVPLSDIEKSIVQSAIARNSFFKFLKLKRYFPQLTSMDDFRISEDYLGGLEITFKGDLLQLESDPSHKLKACCDLLGKIESELKEKITEYEGTKQFHEQRINAIFTDKILKFRIGHSRVNDENHDAERVARVEDWLCL